MIAPRIVRASGRGAQLGEVSLQSLEPSNEITPNAGQEHPRVIPPPPNLRARGHQCGMKMQKGV